MFVSEVDEANDNRWLGMPSPLKLQSPNSLSRHHPPNYSLAKEKYDNDKAERCR